MAKKNSSKTPLDVLDYTKRYNQSETFLDRLDSNWGLFALRVRSLESQFLRDGIDSRTAKRILKTHQYLENFRKRLDTGNTLSILHAVRFCGKEGVPLPTWLANALTEQIDRFMNPEHSSPLYDLNDCFTSGVFEGSKPSKRKTVARDHKAGMHFWIAVHELVARDSTISSVNEAIDTCLTLEPWGFAKTKAKQLFQRIEDAQITLLPKYQGLSQKLAKRRHPS
jgi:hypothetical protein